MIASEVIRNTIDTSQSVLDAYLGDLTDEELLIRAVPGSNHIAWQLGHLIAAEHGMITGGGFQMPALPDGFNERYTSETSSVDDAAKFLKKDEYIQLLGKQREGTMAALATMSENDLEKPAPESMHAYAKTLGELFNMIGVHQMMHVGQFVQVRRKLEKPITI